MAKAATKVTSTESMEELIASNITSLTDGLSKSTETIDLLAKKVTSMACHVVALEALLAEVIRLTGVDLAQVNQRIRSRIASDTDTRTDSEVVIDIAATIASPVAQQ